MSKMSENRINTGSHNILIPTPNYGFDPTEASIPWKYLREAGHRAIFATPQGKQAQADIRMSTGRDLGILKKILMADLLAVKTYQELEKSPEFQSPLPYDQLRSTDFDAIFLPGGHDPGMREYLESKTLQNLIVEFFEQDKPVAAICHGTLLVGRSVSSKTGKSVLWGRKTTGLTERQELIAYQLTRSYLGDYYRTYPEITMEAELKSYLRDPSDYSRGPGFPIPLSRDTPSHPERGYTVLDGKYLSARWPGDANRFGMEWVQLLSKI